MGDADLDRTLMALLAPESDDSERAATPGALPSLDQRVEILLRAVHGPDAAITADMRRAGRAHLLATMADDLAEAMAAPEPDHAAITPAQRVVAATPAAPLSASLAPLWSGLARSLQQLAETAADIFTVPRMRMVAVPLVALLIVGSIWTKDWVEQHGSAIENPAGNGPADNGPATRSLTPPQPVDAAREQQLKQKIAEQEAAHGPDDPGLARTLVDLAVLYRSTGRYEAAEGLCKRALAIQQTALGPKDPDTIRTLKELATIYRLEGRTRDADQILSKLEQR